MGEHFRDNARERFLERRITEEIRRLGMLKIFFVAESEYYSRISGIWSVGFFHKLSARDEKTINDFYTSRNLIFRPAERLVSQEFKSCYHILTIGT